MGATLNVPWHRYALIGYLSVRLQNNAKALSKTAIQKLIYLLQEAKEVPCGYDYTFYNYGPYAPELSRDLEYTDFLGVISLVSRDDTPTGYAILPGEKYDEIRQRGQDFLDQYATEVEEVISSFGMYSAKDLELRATIYYCYRFATDKEQLLSKEEIISQVQKLKPRFSSGVVSATVEELHKKDYIDFRLSA